MNEDTESQNFQESGKLVDKVKAAMLLSAYNFWDTEFYKKSSLKV